MTDDDIAKLEELAAGFERDARLIREAIAVVRGIPSLCYQDDPILTRVLPVRVRKAIRVLRVSTWSQLADCSLSDVACLRNVGNWTLNEIRGMLRDRGLCLNGDDMTPWLQYLK
jgi:hypothetical protein